MFIRILTSSVDHVRDDFYERLEMRGGEMPNFQAWFRDAAWDDERRLQDLQSVLPNRRLPDCGCGAIGSRRGLRTLWTAGYPDQLSPLGGMSELKGWAAPFLKQSTDTWRLALEVNLTAPFVLTQACAEALAASGHGSVVNVGSIYGMVGPDMSMYENTTMGNPAAYAASKGGLLQLTRWLATILAPDVRVNAITPGGVERSQPAVFRERYVAETPLKRMATEEDFKGAVAYLASDLSAYVTGHNLVVDGGWTVW